MVVFVDRKGCCFLERKPILNNSNRTLDCSLLLGKRRGLVLARIGLRKLEGVDETVVVTHCFGGNYYI